MRTSPAKSLFALGIILFAIGAEAAVVNREGRYFELGKVRGEPIYVQSIRLEDLADGSLKSDSVIKDRDGKIWLTETAISKGDRLLSHKIDQLQINEGYELEVKDGKVRFRTFKLAGEQRTEVGSGKSEDYTSAFITGPVAAAFLKNHWPALEKGEAVSADFGIFELEKSISFKFSKETLKGDEAKNLGVQMKLSNFLFSMFVSAIHFQLEPETFQLIRYRGRTPVRVKDGEKWAPLDAEIIYVTK